MCVRLVWKVGVLLPVFIVARFHWYYLPTCPHAINLALLKSGDFLESKIRDKEFFNRLKARMFYGRERAILTRSGLRSRYACS